MKIFIVITVMFRLLGRDRKALLVPSWCITAILCKQRQSRTKQSKQSWSSLHPLAAYLSRTDYNIFTVDWEPLTIFPCYLSALSNTRLVGQCTAKLYAFIMDQGRDARKTTCVGHSLGAHICGMVSNHLDLKQHKIVGKWDWIRNEYGPNTQIDTINRENIFSIRITLLLRLHLLSKPRGVD